jgi:hypothetical protein
MGSVRVKQPEREPHGVTSQKTTFFIVIAVKASNLKEVTDFLCLFLDQSPHYLPLNCVPLNFSPIWRCPTTFMNVAMWEHCTFDNEIFRCGKIYYSNSIIITDFV